jgi:Protein of unknown function (DUF3168)
MDLDTALFQSLTQHTGLFDLLQGRVYPVLAPTQAQFPFLIYQQIGYDGVQHMRGAGALARSTYQLDSYGVSQVSVRQVAETVRRALDGFHGLLSQVDVRQIALVSQAVFVEDDEGGGQEMYYRVSQDFDIWHVQDALGATIAPPP